MLGYYLHDLSPFIVRFSDSFGLRWYGFAYVMAFACGYWLYLRLVKQGYSEMKPEQVGDFITWGAIFGVMIGGRIGWVLFYGMRQDHSVDAWYWPLEVWKGGMSSHGGILGLVFFTLWYARRHGLSWTGIGDNLCVVAPVGLFIVRVANFINGELFGRVTTVPWGVKFPTELESPPSLEAIRHDPVVREQLQQILQPRHPSQLYEAMLEGVVLFAILWVVRTRFRVPRGVLTGLFFVLYALLRIVGEIFRVPDAAWHVGMLSAGQFLSLFLILIGAGFIWFGVRRGGYEPVDRAVPQGKRL